jgi:spore maturation protein CgeB
MCKKVFFIIEENEEMYRLKLDKIVVYYKINDFNDLKEKIIYYLNNEDKREEVIDNCYSYIITMHNSDKLIESVLKYAIID